jgi:hypothetical protein
LHTVTLRSQVLGVSRNPRRFEQRGNSFKSAVRRKGVWKEDEFIVDGERVYGEETNGVRMWQQRYLLLRRMIVLTGRISLHSNSAPFRQLLNVILIVADTGIVMAGWLTRDRITRVTCAPALAYSTRTRCRSDLSLLGAAYTVALFRLLHSLPGWLYRSSDASAVCSRPSIGQRDGADVFTRWGATPHKYTHSTLRA